MATWSEVTPPAAGGQNIIDFCALGAGVVVAVGTGGLAYRSTDGGLGWGAVTLGEANAMTGLAFDGTSVLIAVSSNGTHRIQRSTDAGVTWTPIVAPVVAGWTGVTWDATNALFVAVASSGAGHRTMNSPDGTAWTSHAAAAAKTWVGVTASAAVVVAAAFGTSTQQIMTSTNGGASWTLQTHGNWDVAAGGLSEGSSVVAWSAAVGLFAVSARNGAPFGIMTSPNGVAWTFQTIPDTTQQVQGIVAAPLLGGWLATTSRVAGVNVILTSTDGTTWMPLDPTIYRDWTPCGWSESTGTFVSWDLSGHAPATILVGLFGAVTVSAIAPTRGSKRGGTVATVTGSGLGGVTSVLFGTAPAVSVVPAGDGLSVTCITPAHAVGPVDVTVS